MLLGMDNAATALDTINLDGDDGVHLIDALEGSFGVRFGDETSRWFTIGDVYDALLQRVPTSADAGLCATSMAFYRLRAALTGAGASRERVTPQTKVAGLTPLRPKTLRSRLSQELGVRELPNTMSWFGCLGATCVVLGFFALCGAAAVHRLWPGVFLLPSGSFCFAPTSAPMDRRRSATLRA
jgi:hypothetical protein